MNNHEKNDQAEKNKMIQLAEELRTLTLGMCRVGPGPFGFGVYTSPLSNVGAVVCMDPDPYGEVQLPDSVTEYTVTVRPIDRENGSGSFCRVISDEKLLELAESRDIATQAVAKGLLQICGRPVTISEQENSDAYENMVDAEINDRGIGLTEEEAQKITELRWYESKTPQEIADYQLFEERLCMPVDKFQAAVEAALGRDVDPEELQSNRQDLQAEYREMSQSEASQGAVEQQDPGGGFAAPTM